MGVKQNVLDFASEFPLASMVVEKLFYIDDFLTGADSAEDATTLQMQLFSRGGFLLRKWNCISHLISKIINLHRCFPPLMNTPRR